jgi:lipid A disaccharide synthetase
VRSTLKPFCIVYKSSWLNYQIAKRVIKIPYLGLANILMNECIAKEFLQYDFNVENLSLWLKEISANATSSQKLVSKLELLRENLSRNERITHWLMLFYYCWKNKLYLIKRCLLPPFVRLAQTKVVAQV